MRYLITVSAGARRTSDHTFAVESAFAQHLRELQHELGNRFTEIVVAMTWLDDASWARLQPGLTTIDESRERIRFVPLHRFGCGRFEFWRHGLRTLKVIASASADSDLIHSDFSHDIFRPTGALFCLFGKLKGKPVIAVEDMDRRRDAEMLYRIGYWSARTYWLCRYVYDPIRNWLQRAYVRHVDLMLFKEQQQVEDYGRGARHVRLFLDPNFSQQHVVGAHDLDAKLASLSDPTSPLRLLYFGRLVTYKGVEKMLDAVAIANSRGANVTLDILGAGEQLDSLKARCTQLGIRELVTFMAPIEYGPSFFEILRARDVLLACPLSADTPRSVWDALASGMPLVAFDTPFYRSMGLISKAVETVPWPEVEPLAEKLVELSRDKAQIIPLVKSAVATARSNSGADWLKRRVEWVDELLIGAPAAGDPVRHGQILEKPTPGSRSPGPDNGPRTSRPVDKLTGWAGIPAQVGATIEKMVQCVVRSVARLGGKR